MATRQPATSMASRPPLQPVHVDATSRQMDWTSAHAHGRTWEIINGWPGHRRSSSVLKKTDIGPTRNDGNIVFWRCTEKLDA